MLLLLCLLLLLLLLLLCLVLLQPRLVSEEAEKLLPQDLSDERLPQPGVKERREIRGAGGVNYRAGARAGDRGQTCHRILGDQL